MLRPRIRSLTIALAFLGILVGISAPVANAAESISDYRSAVTLLPDTTMLVTETINYDFDGEPDRHGIQRDLVLRDSLSNGNTQLYDVAITTVTANGQPVPFSTTDNYDYLSVRIGDPNRTVSGTQTYVVSYTVTGALRALGANEASPEKGVSAGDIELYWDLVGDGWSVPINSASAEIQGPVSAVAAACYYGLAGSTSECNVSLTELSVVSSPVALGAHESLTLVTAYPPSAFTITPQPAIEEPFTAPGWAWPLTLVLVLLCFGAPIGYVLSKRRTLKGKALDGAPVQFEPPDGVRPAQLQAALQGSVDVRGAVATLLDLTARGHLTLKADDEGFLKKDSLTITRTGAAPDALVDWESTFVNSLLGGSDSRKIAGYDAALATALGWLSGTLAREAASTGRRTTQRNRGLRLALVGIGIGGIGLAFVLAVLLPGGAFALLPALALLISCITAMFLVPVHETEESANFQSRARGFRKLLDTDASADRREFAQRSGLEPFAIFATMLPYAVIFNLAQSWTQQFPDITPAQLNDAGFYFGSSLAMWTFIDATQSAMTVATTTPSRSSDSGFSGGSAGGGGGGGGGGSW